MLDIFKNSQGEHFQNKIWARFRQPQLRGRGWIFRVWCEQWNISIASTICWCWAPLNNTVFLCSFPTTFTIFSLCFLPNNHSLFVLEGTIATLMQRSVDFQPIFSWLQTKGFPQSWKPLDLLAVCTGHPIKSPSLLKSSNCFKVRSCSPKFECFIPLLQRIWYHTRRKKKKKEENSNNSNHQSNAPGNISDLLKDDMEMVQRLENFSSVLWRSGHNREKEGKKFCFVTVAADPFLPQNPWSHYRSYSPTCTKLSDRWPRAI